MPRFNVDTPAIYLQTETCGYKHNYTKHIDPKKHAAHTPQNCSNCKQGIHIIPLNAYTGFCNIDSCTYETEPVPIEIAVNHIKEHRELAHKPKKGRPKKNE